MRHIVVFLLFVPFSVIANDAQPCHDHILMAQRLAEDSNDSETRKKAYDRIINSITKLIDSKGNSSQENT